MTSFFAHLSAECQFVICFLVSGVGLSLCTLLCISRWHQCQKCTSSWIKGWPHCRMTCQHELFLLLKFIYSCHCFLYLIFLSCLPAHPLRWQIVGFCLCVIERKRDKKWEIVWMKGCDIVDTDRTVFAWHVIHLDYLKKWAMNSILWFTCKMTHSWSGLCVCLKNSNQCAYDVGICICICSWYWYFLWYFVLISYLIGHLHLN